jgi:adenylate cyclase
MKPHLHEIPRKKRMLFGLGASFASSLVICAALFSIPQINVLEWRLADFWAQQEYGSSIARNVAVIGIDEPFLKRYGWPLEKDLYGDCIAYLSEMGARSVAFDIVFADNLDACGKGDSLFREIVRLSPQVVMSCGAIMDDPAGSRIKGRPNSAPARYSLGKSFTAGIPVSGAILPYPALLDKCANIGFFNLSIPFIDGIDRKMPLFFKQDSLVFPSLALAAAMSFSDTPHRLPYASSNAVSVNGNVIPLDPDGFVYVNFIDSIPCYTMTDLRSSHRQWLRGEQPAIGRDRITGRAVFIGNTAFSLSDFGVTPVSNREPSGKSPNMLMHARAAETLLSGNAIRIHGRPVALLLSLFLTCAIAILFYLLSAHLALLGGLVLGIAWLILSRYCYLHGHFIPVLESLSAGSLLCILATLAVYFEKEINRKYLHSVFGCYLSPKIIDTMYKNQLSPVLGGEEVYATAFFSDIENFSTFAEVLTPAELIKNLNEYFEVMTRTLLDCDGTLDKFIGDAIVAFFGAPYNSTTHAYDACRAAVAMQEALAGLRLKWQQKSQAPDAIKNLKMRIGINTGRFVTGNIGCAIRMNYTMIGDTVNLASRLEGAAKQYGIYTVVGEETRAAAQEHFHFRLLDYIKVKGRSKPGSIHQLMGKRREHDEQLEELIPAYENAMEAYVQGRFTEAAHRFEESLKFEKYPGLKNPSSVMRGRCSYLLKNPPDQWDGVFIMTTK